MKRRNLLSQNPLTIAAIILFTSASSASAQFGIGDGKGIVDRPSRPSGVGTNSPASRIPIISPSGGRSTRRTGTSSRSAAGVMGSRPSSGSVAGSTSPSGTTDEARRRMVAELKVKIGKINDEIFRHLQRREIARASGKITGLSVHWNEARFHQQRIQELQRSRLRHATLIFEHLKNLRPSEAEATSQDFKRFVSAAQANYGLLGRKYLGSELGGDISNVPNGRRERNRWLAEPPKSQSGRSAR